MHTLTCSTAKLIALSAVVLRLGGAVERITTVSVTGSDNAVPNLRAIKMVDRLRGWSTGERSLWVTLDGARTWRMALIGDPVTSTISSFAWGVLADGKAWAVVSDPFKDPPSEIVRISPDGRTEELALPCLPASNCFPKAADFDRTGEKGILFGLKPIGPERNQVVEFRTLDAAQHWTETKAPHGVVLGKTALEVRIATDQKALAAINCELFITSDFGDSWDKVDSRNVPFADNLDTPPCYIRLVGPHNGWLRTNDGQVLRTDNGGRSWTVSQVGRDNSFETGWDEWVSFADSLDGLMVVSGRVLETRDAGRTWKRLTKPGENFWSVSCAGGVCILRSDTRVARFTFDK